MRPEKTTIVFPINEAGVILGMKKRGFGKGWWNGFGGKLKDGESYDQAAIRETFEESHLSIKKLVHVANLHFYFDGTLSVVSRAYISDEFDGGIIETDEMKPRQFSFNNLPYESMWPADRFWIPHIFDPTERRPRGYIALFSKDKELHSIEEVNPSDLEDRF